MRTSLVFCAPLALMFGCATTPSATRTTATAGRDATAGISVLLDGGSDAAARAQQLLANDTSPLGRLGAALAADELGDRTAALRGWLDAAERSLPLVCRADTTHRCDPWAQPVLRVATAALGQSVDDLASLRELGDRALALDLGKLSPIEAGDLHLVKASITARLGDRAGADRHLHEAGCGGSFYVAGPFGELATLDLDTPFDHSATRPQKPLGCRVLLDGPRGRSGVLYAGRKLELARAETIVLELEDTGPFRLIVDGHVVFGTNEDDRPPPGNRRVEVQLSAGTHDVWLKVAAPDGRLEIGATLLASNKVKILDLAPNGAPEKAATKTGAIARLVEEPLVARASSAGYAVTTPSSQIELLVGALLALAERDADAAEELATALATARPRAATAQLLLGLAYLVDNSRPARFASDLARRAMSTALELRPTFLRPVESLVELDLAEDRARAATTRLAPIPLGRDWRLDLLRYRALRARSLGEQGEVALHAAEQQRTLACPILAALTSLYRERRELAELAKASESYSRCADGREIKAELAAERFDFVTAIAEYRRLLERNPLRHAARRELARALRSQGALEPAIQELTALVEAVPKNVVYRIELADALSESGQRARAIQVLTAGQKEQPESEELSRALLALDGKPRASRWLEPFRVDGLRLIEDYRKDTLPTDRAPAALVLDRTVVYLFPSGARLTLTHNIIQLLSKEGISKFAEVEVPDGAELLRLRVIKRDGSVREAEMVSGKQTPSLPDLDVGDFIEFEHVEPTATPAAFPGGFLSERFYFQSFDAPLDRSEYVVVAPKTMKLQVDTRGGAPTAKEEARGDDIVRTWQVRRAPQAVGEPEAVPHSEYLPSVRVAAGLSADHWRRFLVNGQAGLLRPNREMRRLVEQLTADRSRPEERLRALDTWVRMNIQGGGTIDERASFVLERKQGSRSLLLLALLRLAHLDAEMVLARPVGAAELDSELPDLEGFNEPLLRVRIGDEWRPVDPRYRHGPAGVLGPRLRGVEALRVAVGGPTRVTLPATNQDGRKMTIDYAINDTLGARVKVTERLTGVPALEWREAIETLAADRIRPEFEQQTLGQHFPGASLTALGWQHEKDDDEPLIVQYEFTLPTVGRQIERALFLSAPYPALLMRRYGLRKQRRTALRLGFVAPTEIETTYHGSVIPESIAPVQVDARFGSFSLRGERSNQSLKLVTRLAMPTSVVRPTDYDEFVRFAATVDQAELTAAKIAR